MDTIKQIFILLLFIAIGTATILATIIIASENFDSSKEAYLFFFISFALLTLLILYVVKDEVNRRKENTELGLRSSSLIDFSYNKDEWVIFVNTLLKQELLKYYGIFSGIIFIVLLILITIYHNDKAAFYVFTFITNSILLPILISSIFRFIKRKKDLLNTTEPHINVSQSGVIINSVIFQSFRYIYGEVYDVEINSLNSIECIVITSFHKSGNNGRFRKNYIPIPSNYKKDINDDIEIIKQLIPKNRSFY